MRTCSEWWEPTLSGCSEGIRRNIVDDDLGDLFAAFSLVTLPEFVSRAPLRSDRLLGSDRISPEEAQRRRCWTATDAGAQNGADRFFLNLSFIFRDQGLAFPAVGFRFWLIKNKLVRSAAIAGGIKMNDLLEVDLGKHDYDWALIGSVLPGIDLIRTELVEPDRFHPILGSRTRPARFYACRPGTGPDYVLKLDHFFFLSDTPCGVSDTVSSRVRHGVLAYPRVSPGVRVSNMDTAWLFEVSMLHRFALSRFSATQSENSHTLRQIRSSSVTRSSISSTYSNSFSQNNRIPAVNTSTASVTSRPSTSSRPTTPGSRSCSISSTRSSVASRPVQLRSSTPAKTRPSLLSPGDKPQPLQNARPSTPAGRHQLSSNSISNPNSVVARSSSRPSTPARRPTTPSASRNPGPISSRPNSPGPRLRAPVRPIDLPDFPTDTPPNLRTKLPERPASAGRTRPGMALTTVKGNSNSEVARRHTLPAVARSKLPQNLNKIRSNGNDNDPVLLEIQKPVLPEPGIRRSSKLVVGDSTGFGRTISKMSMDMALRHMDIKQSMGGIRATSLFPHSIRSSALKSRPARTSEPVVPVTHDELPTYPGSCNKTVTEESNLPSYNNGKFAAKHLNKDFLITKESDLDLYGSSRYEAMLLKEDLKNTNWLHSIEDKSDQSPSFDHRFESLPEPFSPL
ncbi:hypothetical protein AXF42_Ash013761 [Apostasia shenzhenica]|uniref:Uncharacterized protein n=1 Tax=Apostasia shenzhenica TaxID=1088818 RepID=A0A2I0A4S0_9ASPA|nr:hypothetical protein AXF42_Ash013761 [Apostasia shenzhenica]